MLAQKHKVPDLYIVDRWGMWGHAGSFLNTAGLLVRPERCNEMQSRQAQKSPDSPGSGDFFLFSIGDYLILASL